MTSPTAQQCDTSDQTPSRSSMSAHATAPPARKRAIYLLEYSAVRMIEALLRLVPQRLAISLGRACGRLATHLFKKRVALAHENLQRAFGSKLTMHQRRDIVRGLFQQLGEAFAESVICTPRDIDRVVVEGLDILEHALQQGRGAIILVPHFGAWEMASHVFGRCLESAAVIYKPLKNPYLDTYLMQTRLRSKLHLIPSKKALRQVLAHLKAGRAVGILYDQNAGRRGVPATFFGHRAFTYAAPAVFAAKTGCPVLPAYMRRDPGFRRYSLVIGEPFPLMRTGDEAADHMANTQQYNDFLEDLVRREPQHWFGWIHNRWKQPREIAGAPPA